MADLVLLKFKRGQIKGNVTRFQNYLDTINLDQINETTITQLKIRLDRFESIFAEFNERQSEIELLLFENEASEADKQKEFEERDTFETSYFNLFAKATNIISSFQSPTSNNNANNSQTHISATDVASSQVKLPVLKLPSFNGAFERYLEFRDAFAALVDTNSSLSDIQKFYYLKSCLEKEAAQLIESVEVTAANYQIALTMLKDRYENKKLILHNYVKGMFEASPVLKESHVELRKLYDNYNKNLRALKALGQPTEFWDTLIIYLLSTKFDTRTRRDWESFRIAGELPTMNDINTFLKEKCEVLEKVEMTKNDNFSKTSHNKFSKPHIRATSSFLTSGNRSFKCYFCKRDHSVFKCDDFLKLNITARKDEIRKLKLCFNCFNPNHSVYQCDKTGCKTCHRRHNTLLHETRENSMAGGSSAFPGANVNNESSTTIAASNTGETSGVSETIVTHAANLKNTFSLLTTALIMIIREDTRERIYARALIDTGSQSNFITERLCNKLKLKKSAVNFAVVGLGETSLMSAKMQTNLIIESRCSNYSQSISCLVVPEITQAIPAISFDSKCIAIPSDITLADPKFNISAQTDILLGVGIYYDILIMQQLKRHGLPTLQNSKLGWLVGGDFFLPSVKRHNTMACLTIDDKINDNLVRFWQLDECDDILRIDNLDFCERFFKDTVKRDETGRFVVKIPFRESVSMLGSSKQMALQRFYALEKRLLSNDNLRVQYCNFMREYKELNHMSLISDKIEDLIDIGAYYLPHHAVVKNESLTTKLRVVFDASATTEGGLSLNDVQYAGPTIQNDLFSIILRFRKHVYVLNADISKMYRQILIDENERRFQRIFWRDNPRDQVKCYELNTVTYGTASAPFLAIRCMKEIANIHENTYPEASEIIRSDFYVDDLLTGSNSIEELLGLQRQITTILEDAGFVLRKWLSNSPEVCRQLQIKNDIEAGILHLGDDEQNKTLGVIWNANLDFIQYRIREIQIKETVSKRIILSITSQIFDPLGLLGPVVVFAKLIMQGLWKEKYSWDQDIPNPIRKNWLTFCTDLKTLNSLRIDRCIFPSNFKILELHAFADASEKAYGACLYVRYKGSDGSYYSNLLCAKSRIAPIKQITLPRLELCAAVIAAKLTEKVCQALKVQFTKKYYWSDSTITLSWLQASPDRWKTFVGNRVSVIQRLTNINDWYHVRSEDNPADCLSRGSYPSQLLNNTLWWKGPSWLSSDELLAISNEALLNTDDIPERRIVSHLAIFKNDFDLFVKYSTWTKLQRVTAYCCRFINNLKLARAKQTCQLGNMTMVELENATTILVRISQVQSFPRDYDDMKRVGSVGNSSSILSLNPFIDDKGVIRVGGRLKNANISYEKRHPIILSHKHQLTKLIMRFEHKRLLHCGPQQLLYSIRERYWPTSGRSLARKIVHECIVCFRAKPKLREYLMGNLIPERVNHCYPFINTGCDYAGPFLLKDRRTRNCKLIKCYVCVFVCMATKAIHLDIVSDLTSDAFLACLKRFIARRGKPSKIFSDNSTTFIGAKSELNKFFKSHSEKITTELIKENISWSFIPPKSPTFGGLWEAGVKSMKYHLKRIVGNQNLHYEEFMTVIIQIESILNSRPISQLSSSPNDFLPLTPAHFLIGRTITSIPEYSLEDIKQGRLNKLQHIQQMVQHFWQRWSKEYLSEIQTRTKWKRHLTRHIKVGDLVLMKEDNLPPLLWKTGRVLETHPGTDEIVRVITVKCGDGSVYKRALTKICVLPIEPSNHEL